MKLSLRATAGAAVKSCSRSKRKQLLGTARVSKARGNPFLRPLVIAKPCNGCGNPFSLRGITDSFALRAQNDITFVIAKEQSDCGNPFPPFQRNKSSCARAARAPYFCTDRNRGKSRRTPFRSGFRTFLFERTI